MRFSEDFLDELRSRVDIEELVGHYAEIRHRGSRNPTCLCPFHSEKTPSFVIYPENWSFYCFGCGVGGSGITFVQRIENLSFTEAVKFLCERVGMQMPDDGADDEAMRLRRRCYEANREAARFFYNALRTPAGAGARQYLEKRGLSPETVQKFGLGYAPDSWDALTRHMFSKGFTGGELEAFFLARRSAKGHYYDLFRNRLMIPIVDLRNNVVAFGGRVLDDSKPKYVNTSDTVVYKKGDGIYALNLAKNEKGRTLILCEGYMDVIAMHQAGFPNAVAALGTAFTAQQVSLLSRYCDELLLSFDADEAGQRATARAMRMLQNAPMKVRVMKLEGGKDPDEIIKTEGAGRIEQIIKTAPNETEYKLGLAQKKYDLTTADGKSSYLNEAAAVLASVTSPVERDVYIGKVASDLGVTRDALRRETERQSRRVKNTESREAFRQDADRAAGNDPRIPNPERSRYLRAAKAEETILTSLLQNPDYYKRFRSRLSPEDFITKVNRALYEGLGRRIEEGHSIEMAAFSADAPDDTVNLLSYLYTNRDKIAGTPAEYEGCINTLLEEKQKLSFGEAKDMTDEEFMRRLEELRKRKNKPEA